MFKFSIISKKIIGNQKNFLLLFVFKRKACQLLAFSLFLLSGSFKTVTSVTPFLHISYSHLFFGYIPQKGYRPVPEGTGRLIAFP